MLLRSIGLATASGFALGYGQNKTKEAKCWIYRDDIGAWWGIKGYEEAVTEVGSHHGHTNWPQFDFFGAYDAGSVRRGFQVFSKNCANCHGMFYRSYDFLLDKGYKQLELASMITMFSINPAHQHFKQYYFQEWDDRDRVLTDQIYAPYISQDQAKKANGGVWPTDFSKIRLRAGSIVYVYNILTGYNYKPPYGTDVPKGKYFNPYFDHMIVGMPRQLYDGLIDYDDGTPASTPQMAYDVTNFISYMQRRVGGKRPDRMFRYNVILFAMICLTPLRYILTNGASRNFLSYRFEAYAVRDGLYYKHFRTGQKSIKANYWRGKSWA
jgi:ubiquinol-cytochrome c reductase cytochrome c1 subunit